MHILPVHVSIAVGGESFSIAQSDSIATTRGTYSIIIFNIKNPMEKGVKSRVSRV